MIHDTSMEMRVAAACGPTDIAACRQLFREYATDLDVDLGFQGFEAELAGLPGSYAPPRGCLLLAREGDQATGCVALRPLTIGACEMKRLFVRPAFRGNGAGRLLTENAIQQARSIGYTTMKLDTLNSLHAALRLYETLGFVPCPAYYETPLADTVFMELKL